MNIQCLARATPKIARTSRLYRRLSTIPPTSSDPPPPPERPPHPPLPSSIARDAARNPNRDANIALANTLLQDIDRTRYKVVRKYDDYRAATLDDAAERDRVKSLERQLPRKSGWKAGDVYAPHDLSAVEAMKWRKRKSSERDVFDILGINPLHEYKVCGIYANTVHGVFVLRMRRWGGMLSRC